MKFELFRKYIFFNIRNNHCKSNISLNSTRHLKLIANLCEMISMLILRVNTKHSILQIILKSNHYKSPNMKLLIILVSSVGIQRMCSSRKSSHSLFLPQTFIIFCTTKCRKDQPRRRKNLLDLFCFCFFFYLFPFLSQKSSREKEDGRKTWKIHKVQHLSRESLLAQKIALKTTPHKKRKNERYLPKYHT